MRVVQIEGRQLCALQVLEALDTKISRERIGKEVDLMLNGRWIVHYNVRQFARWLGAIVSTMVSTMVSTIVSTLRVFLHVRSCNLQHRD